HSRTSPQGHMKLTTILCAASAALILSSCSALGAGTTSDNELGMWLVPVNHTHRYAPNIVVDKAWAGNVRAFGGGGGAACCLAGRADWSKPVLVEWTWGYEEDPVTRKITVPEERRKALVSFPG